MQNDNQSMRRFFIAAAVLNAAWLVACNPTFNWREVDPDTSTLVALLPCKPDKASRVVSLAGRQPVVLDMLGCDAGGATFAIAHAEISDPAQAGEMLAQWRAVTLANLRATSSTDAPFTPKGSLALPQSVLVVASGQRADGHAVTAHAAWFAQSSSSGIQLFHAVVYANKIGPEVTETFFSGLKLQ